ncbi:hypothetical protein P691DRAFT_688966 [Macrolepiota fuliginosa MF-IS2]|uniref:Uncharacterized protein n=1 Tax=Macrolepiota fuliginosa MF-IS2 TaxID=1400762 RepID=A0A9P5WW80_9AGAR|nr:hypothetical protein P691DRAFT_688966 [Macrolepiota fuliginosa MF-IS2]
MAMQGKLLWGHFDGTSICPVLTILTHPSSTPPSVSSPGTQTSRATTAATSATWDHSESLAQSLLMSCLPTSTAFIVNELSTAHEMWEAITNEYTYKGAYSQTCLHCEFLSS